MLWVFFYGSVFGFLFGFLVNHYAEKYLAYLVAQTKEEAAKTEAYFKQVGIKVKSEVDTTKDQLKFIEKI